MKKVTLFAVLVVLAFGCKKGIDSLIGNTLYRWSLDEYTGPDVGWKTIKADTVRDLIDDGIVFKAIEDIPGYPGHPYKYIGNIYQGVHRFWPTKPDYSFETTYISDTSFKLGNDQNGYNIAYFNGAGETLTIIERTPVNGRKYVYHKVSN